MMENGKYIVAYYASGKKDLIIADWEYDDGEMESVLIDVDLSNPLYRQLLETFTIDQISNTTNEKNKWEAEQFKLMVKEISEEYGLLIDPDAEDKFKNNTFTVDHIFNPPTGTDGDDMLFNIKLNIFDMEAVNNSEDTDLKKQLREATTPLEALYIAGKFLYE